MLGLELILREGPCGNGGLLTKFPHPVQCEQCEALPCEQRQVSMSSRGQESPGETTESLKIDIISPVPFISFHSFPGMHESINNFQGELRHN